MTTTPYSVSINLGSSSYNNYVNTPITAPLNTNQYPCAMPYHSYGTLVGIRPTPPQFFPGQDPPCADSSVNSRKIFLRTYVNSNEQFNQNSLGKTSSPQQYVVLSSQRKIPVSSHVNYIPPIPSSLKTTLKKSNAVGQSAYKVGLPDSSPISTKSYYPSGTRSAIKRVRSGGCVAPKKKGAIENYSLRNGKVCAWGALVRQNY